jgi:putative ABC transport system ATP-binding protein
MVANQATRVAARAEKAVKIYGTGGAAVRALDGVDVGFEGSRFTAIMGPSGSGKSTLLHCLAGLDQVTSGEVYLGDVALRSLNDRELTMLRRERVGFVFQAFNLIPTLNAAENITLPLSIADKKPEPGWYETVIETLKLADRLDHRPSELSGGQQQRVAMARALVSKPDIIFADEPSGNLDSNSGAELLGFLRSAVDDLGQTIIMVTHDPNAASYADRIVFLHDGRVAAEMTEPNADRILDQMKTLEFS